VHAFVRGTARAIDTNIIDYFDGAARPGLYAVRAPAPAVEGRAGRPCSRRRRRRQRETQKGQRATGGQKQRTHA